MSDQTPVDHELVDLLKWWVDWSPCPDREDRVYRLRDAGLIDIHECTETSFSGSSSHKASVMLVQALRLAELRCAWLELCVAVAVCKEEDWQSLMGLEAAALAAYLAAGGEP